MDTSSTISWKEKAIQRQIEVKNLKKRIKEARLSRDNWKTKSHKHKCECKLLNNELMQIKKN